jgi:glutamine amidotransferase
MRIAIVDYGAGNLRSASRAVLDAGAAPSIVAEPAGLAGADAIVVPGVGAFAPAIRRLAQARMTDALRDAARAGVPVVGICLGMQLLFDRSEGGDAVPGLGLIPGRVVRLPDGVRCRTWGGTR